jgi:16S rRNA (guanine527-N7)-methyltransferase
MPDPDDHSAVGPNGAVDSALRRALLEIQRRGAIGGGPIDEAVAHAEQFAAALPSWVEAGARVVDLGSGGGLPGLVLVARRPDLLITLVERRAKRADLLMYGVRALDATDRVRVVAGDVRTLMTAEPASFDVVTARSFAAPTVVLEVATALLCSPGVLLVSEPPSLDDRWSPAGVADAGLVDDGRRGAVRRFLRP